MAFTLRPANKDDEPAIKALVSAANINPMGIHWQRFLVAEDKGQIIGIGQVKVHGDGSRELASIATIPTRRGEGVATAIINALLAAEKSAGTGALYLTCRSHMQPFYEEFGFCRVDSTSGMPRYFRWVMRLMRLMFATSRLFSRRGGGLVMKRSEV